MGDATVRGADPFELSGHGASSRVFSDEMNDHRLKDTFAHLHALLEEIEREDRDLSPENRRKVTRAVCQVLTLQRPGIDEEAGRPWSPYARVYAPR